MRRILSALPASLAVLAVGAAPALADVAARPEAGTRGSFGGILVALILGALFAVVVIAFAEREAGAHEDGSPQQDDHEAHAEQVDARAEEP